MDSHPLLLNLAERLGWTCLHSLWQGAAIGLALSLALVLMRHRSAAARHALCVVSLILVLFSAALTFVRLPGQHAIAPTPTATITTVPNSAPIAEVSDAPRFAVLNDIDRLTLEVSEPSLDAKPAITWQERLHPCLPWIAAGWFAGVLLFTLRHIGAWLRIRQWRAAGTNVDPVIAEMFEPLREKFHAGSIALCQSALAFAPMLTGLIRPIILLPAQLMTGLSGDEVRAVLAHELAHLARRDAWWNMLQVVIETLFFFHPAVWWMGSRAHMEREHAADDLALGVSDDRRAYAEALVKLAELQLAPALSVPANGGSLVDRIRRIISPPAKDAATPGWTLPALAVVAGLCITFAFRAGAADSKIINVEPGASIQAAIDSAPEGAIIRVTSGRWKERIVIAKPLTLEGAGWEKSSIWPEQHDAEADKRRATLDARIKAATSENEKNAIHKESGPIDEPTIRITSPVGVTVRGFAIRGVSYPDRSVKKSLYEDSLLRLEKARAVIEDCVFAGYYRGLDIASGSHAEIQRCLIAGMWSEGIVVHRDASLTMRESEARNCAYSGIVLGRGSLSSLIENCRISGAAWHGARYDDVSPVFRGNVFFGNARTDIYASGKTKATLQGNAFLSTGVWALLGNEDTIISNTFAGKDAKLGVSGGARPRVTRNIFAGEGSGIECTKVNGNQPESAVVGAPLLEGNLFWKAKFKSDNKEQSLPEGSIEADPEFEAPAQQNYALAPNSRMRSKGIGAANPLLPTGPWPLLPEEKAIIPDGDTREISYWKAPGTVQKSKSDEEKAQRANQSANDWVKDALQLDSEEKRLAAIEAIRAAIESEDSETIRVGLAAFPRVAQVAFDKAAFRPAMRKLLKHPEAGIRKSAVSVLAATGKSSEDVALVIPLVDDPDLSVQLAAAFALKWLTNGDFTGEAGNAIQRLLERSNSETRKQLWGTMWGTKVSPEIERIIVQASRDDDRGTGYSDVFYHALCVHLSKREPTITRLIELLATEDPTNVGGRVLWGLQQGVEADQRPRVAEAAVKVIVARDDGYMRRQAFACLEMYGTQANVPPLKEFLTKSGVTGDFKKQVESSIASIEKREK